VKCHLCQSGGTYWSTICGLPTAKCEIDWRTERATGAIKWEKLKLTLKPEKWHIIEKQLTRGKIKLNCLHHHVVEVDFGKFWNA
jgi:hypothetical protein